MKFARRVLFISSWTLVDNSASSIFTPVPNACARVPLGLLWAASALLQPGGPAGVLIDEDVLLSGVATETPLG